MNSPWGSVQNVQNVAPGVRWVGTASHGGLMIAGTVARSRLSPEALAIGQQWGGLYCYEEDCNWGAPLLEVPEWRKPGVDTEEAIITSLARWHFEYLSKRLGEELPDYARRIAEKRKLLSYA